MAEKGTAGVHLADWHLWLEEAASGPRARCALGRQENAGVGVLSSKPAHGETAGHRAQLGPAAQPRQAQQAGPLRHRRSGRDGEVKFVEDRNAIRLEVRRILEEVLKAEARIDASARQKIENQKRTILEGTQEWDILYRKYYNEEVKKLGI